MSGIIASTANFDGWRENLNVQSNFECSVKITIAQSKDKCIHRWKSNFRTLDELSEEDIFVKPTISEK